MWFCHSVCSSLKCFFSGNSCSSAWCVYMYTVLADSWSGHYDVIAASEPNRLPACSSLLGCVSVAYLEIWKGNRRYIFSKVFKIQHNIFTLILVYMHVNNFSHSKGEPPEYAPGVFTACVVCKLRSSNNLRRIFLWALYKSIIRLFISCSSCYIKCACLFIIHWFIHSFN